VLRYWETEFSQIKPFRGKSKQRLYRRQDVENLFRIKGLLHDQGYTISGARKSLKNSEGKLQKGPGIQPPDKKTSQLMPLIKKELQEILARLDGAKAIGS
jgi:DNA-binding transcriptional MerR regulator